MKMDFTKCPFSAYGSWLSVADLSAERAGKLPAGLWLRGAYGDCGGEIMHLEPLLSTQPVAAQYEMTPGRLTVCAGGGTVEFAFGDSHTIRIRGRGLSLRVTPRWVPAASVIPCPNGAWRVNHATFFHLYQFTPLAGELNMKAPWYYSGESGPAWRCGPIVAEFHPGDGGTFEGAIEHFWDEPAGRGLSPDFDAIVATRETEFDRFAGAFPPVRADLLEAVRAAIHVMWSCVVEPHGNFKRRAMLMSKNWMQYVWPWDQCFNAMGLAAAHPDLAWDQFMLVFDRQLPSGRIHDLMNDLVRQPAFTKRPIHGWTFGRMRDINPLAFEGERIEEAYRVLSRWSDYWLTHRWHEESRLVEIQHPFEAWDNVPDLDLPMPVMEPGCNAALIVQMRVLADLAKELRRPDEGVNWLRRADEMQERMLAHLWEDGRFVSKDRSGRWVREAASCMQVDPILLGESLSIETVVALERWEQRLMTPWGPACEIKGPPRYSKEEGVTAGVWAPAVIMHTDGFCRAGRKDIARQIAEGFASACVAGGTPEGIDHATGQPILDPAYTWTSSVLVDLASHFLNR